MITSKVFYYLNIHVFKGMVNANLQKHRMLHHMMNYRSYEVTHSIPFKESHLELVISSPLGSMIWLDYF